MNMNEIKLKNGRNNFNFPIISRWFMKRNATIIVTFFQYTRTDQKFYKFVLRNFKGQISHLTQRTELSELFFFGVTDNTARD